MQTLPKGWHGGILSLPSNSLAKQVTPPCAATARLVLKTMAAHASALLQLQPKTVGMINPENNVKDSKSANLLFGSSKNSRSCAKKC
jgi:hypothetical protein